MSTATMTTKIKGKKIRTAAAPVLRVKPIAANQRVEIDRDEDGYWGYCKPGWQNFDDESHTFHEDTRAELMAAIKSGLKPCSCDGCVKDLAAA